jgi:hypothetical protein
MRPLEETRLGEGPLGGLWRKSHGWDALEGSLEGALMEVLSRAPLLGLSISI